jgi:hypothetical protein
MLSLMRPPASMTFGRIAELLRPPTSTTGRRDPGARQARLEPRDVLHLDQNDEGRSTELDAYDRSRGGEGRSTRHQRGEQ